MISNNFNLKQLETLVWVADLGSFRKAADHLNTTQPNISSRISHLERSVGVILMHRDAGSVRITPKGKEFLAQARIVLDQADILLEIAERPDLRVDLIRLGVTEMVACTWLREFLRRINEQYPKVSVELMIDLSKNLDGHLSANELDLAVQTAPFGSKASGMLEIGSSGFVWVAAPIIANALPRNLTENDISDHALLTHARHTQSFIDIQNRFATLGIHRTRMSPSSSLTSVLHMALDGMGIAVLPRAMVINPIKERRLVELPISWRPNPLRFAARYHAEKTAIFVHEIAKLALNCAEDFENKE